MIWWWRVLKAWFLSLRLDSMLLLLLLLLLLVLVVLQHDLGSNSCRSCSSGSNSSSSSSSGSCGGGSGSSLHKVRRLDDDGQDSSSAGGAPLTPGGHYLRDEGVQQTPHMVVGVVRHSPRPRTAGKKRIHPGWVHHRVGCGTMCCSRCSRC